MAGSGDAYSPLVVEHFERPRNLGCLEPSADVIDAAAGSIDRGARFHLSARVEQGRVGSVRIETYGCPHCIAAASFVSERLVGATQQQLASWSWRELAQVLEFPAEKRGRLLILEDAIRGLAEAWTARGLRLA